MAREEMGATAAGDDPQVKANDRCSTGQKNATSRISYDGRLRCFLQLLDGTC